MKRVGAHVSASGGASNAVDNARKIGAKAFALFVKNQRQWKAKDIAESQIDLFDTKLSELGIDRKYILPHASYLINLATPNEEMRQKSIESLIVEMKLCKSLGIKQLNIHPGSHLKAISEEESLVNVADSIDRALKEVGDFKIVLENTAGQGSNIGYKLEHLVDIIKNVEYKRSVGVCIDTCHAFAAGYDLTTVESSKQFFDKFMDLLGPEYLSGLHLNDSKREFGSRRDRHESLGKGHIGLECFKYIMNSEYFDDIPLILETVDPEIWHLEIEMLYNLIR